MFRRRKEAKLSTVNQSPGPKTIAACLYAARQLDAVGEGFESPLRQEIGVILQETGAALGWNREKFNGVTSEIRNKLEKNLKDENERLARTYWGTSWHETFREEYERDLLSNEIRLDECEPETRTEICDVVRSVFEALGIVSRDKQV